MASPDIEQSTKLQLDWNKLAAAGGSDRAVVPVVLQDSTSRDVLFVGYTDEAGLAESLSTGDVVLFSTSRQERWHKGATSGDTLRLVEARVNCEQNSLLYLVERTTGRACHTHHLDGRTRAHCYYRELSETGTLRFVEAPQL